MVINVNKNELSSKERRIVILIRLFNHEHLSYQQLSEEYYVSRSSIANDISFIKEILSQENLKLNFDNSGTFFAGGEIQVQKILNKLIINHPENENLVLKKDLLDQVENNLKSSIEKLNVEIPGGFIKNIVISISVMITRSQAGNKIIFGINSELDDTFLNFDNYPLIYELLDQMGLRDEFNFSNDELKYLTYTILGSGLSLFMSEGKIPVSFGNEVKKLISNVGKGITVDFSKDEKLKNDLIVHLYQLVVRVRGQIVVVNPMLESVKRNYSALYGVVWLALDEFSKKFKIKIPDDEVGFITIHFQASLERTQRTKRILFVCPNGIGTSSFVSSKIKRVMPNIDSIEIASMNKLKKMNLKNVDLIISTVELNDLKTPIVNISPMVTKKDLMRIMSSYIDLINNKKSYKQNFDSEIIKKVYFKKISTEKEAVEFLVNESEDSVIDKVKFLDSIFEREELQSTYLGNGFVIPHGNPKYVKSSSVSIVALDDPIKWGSHSVDIVALLMIKAEDSSKLEGVMQFLMNGIDDKNWFISKLMEVID